MKRALFVGTTGSDCLYFLKYIKEEESCFDSKLSQEFNGVAYFTADVLLSKPTEVKMILDLNGKELESLGNSVYRAVDLWKEELPQQMRKLKKGKNGRKKD